MIEFSNIEDIKDQHPRISIALGTFDGVHIGHQKIISRAVQLARITNGSSAVLTFSNHPLAIINPERCPLKLVTAEYKAELIAALGVDMLLSIPFTAEFLKLSPERFISLLINKLRPLNIVVGPNYSFGYKSAGSPNMLKQAGLDFGFNVEIHPEVLLDNNLVSSTLIRQLVVDGKVKQAARLLGRPLKLSGQVVHGDKRGRALGYPTANLNIIPGLAIPANGVYAVYVHFDNQVYRGVANIGSNPTFNCTNKHIEVHLLEFEGNLYDHIIEIDFIDYIRGEVVFSGPAVLKTQIALDVKKSLAILD